jgi:hypothetical protein
MSAREVAERLRKRRRVEKITTEEGVLYVRGLTGKERSEFVARFVEGDLSIKDRILSDQHAVAVALCDERGAQLYESFDEAHAAVCDFQDEDVKAAAKVVMSISGMAAKAVDDAEKKLDAVQS